MIGVKSPVILANTFDEKRRTLATIFNTIVNYLIRTCCKISMTSGRVLAMARRHLRAILEAEGDNQESLPLFRATGPVTIRPRTRGSV
jgi:hypothetical protein